MVSKTIRTGSIPVVAAIKTEMRISRFPQVPGRVTRYRMPKLNLGKTEATKEDKKKTAGDLEKIVQAAKDFQEAADTIADELVRGAKTIEDLPEKTAAMVRRF